MPHGCVISYTVYLISYMDIHMHTIQPKTTHMTNACLSARLISRLICLDSPVPARGHKQHDNGNGMHNGNPPPNSNSNSTAPTMAHG
jgi:hypothetical protein